MLKIGCFSGRIQNVPKSVGGTLGPDGKMRTGEATTNSLEVRGVDAFEPVANLHRLLHTAAATDAEQRAASATASKKCDRAMPGRAGLSMRSALPPRHCIFPGRSMNYYGTGRTFRKRPALHPEHQRRARGLGALQQGRLHHEAVLGQEWRQARAACAASGQSCAGNRIE